MKLKNICAVGILMTILSLSCTKQNVYDSGVSSPYHNSTILEYMRKDPYNWELTVKLIEYAELQDLFDGKVDSLKEITFFAPPSLTVLAYLYNKAEADGRYDVKNNYAVIPYEIKDLDKAWVRSTLLKYVVKGKHLKAEFAFIDQDKPILAGAAIDPSQKGGTHLTSVGGRDIFVYIWRNDYNGVPYAGPQQMFAYSVSFGKYLPLASPDIQPLNGVVHALTTGARLGNI